jgi:Bacterial Ig-like domain (group 1)
MFTTRIRQGLLVLPAAALFACGSDLVLPDSGAGALTLRAASPVTQPGQRGEPVSEPPTVEVRDDLGNPVSDAAVEWQVTAGGGDAIGQTTTDADGRARTEWTLGNGAGVQKLTARVDGAQGSPATFTAAVLF